MTEDKPKKKRVMTPIMLEHLKQARIKALEVRARLKSSETEQIAHAKQKIKDKLDPPIKGKKERIKAMAAQELDDELNNLKLNQADPVPKELKEQNEVKDLEEEELITPQLTENVKVKKAKKIKYVVESSSEEEEEIVYVKKKRGGEKRVSLPIAEPPAEPRPTQRAQEPAVNFGYNEPIKPILLRQPPRRGSRPYY